MHLFYVDRAVSTQRIPDFMASVFRRACLPPRPTHNMTAVALLGTITLGTKQVNNGAGTTPGQCGYTSPLHAWSTEGVNITAWEPGFLVAAMSSGGSQFSLQRQLRWPASH